MSDFDIGVRYLEGTPEDAVGDFVASVGHSNLGVRVSPQKPEVRASIEWLAPTAVVVYLTKGYFDGFLNEMGKDHYAILKRAIVALGRRILDPSAPPAVLISAGGRRSTGRRFSIAYSVVAQIGDGRTIKLLVPKGMAMSGFAEAVEAFTQLLLDKECLNDIVREYDLRTPAFDPVLVWLDPEAAAIQVVTPGPPPRARDCELDAGREPRAQLLDGRGGGHESNVRAGRASGTAVS